MTQKLTVALVALAFMSGAIMPSFGSDMKLTQRSAASGMKLQYNGAAPSLPGPSAIQTKPFPANCVAGFQKFDQNMVMKAGVLVLQEYKCRSAWIECPNFPNYGETWTEFEIEEQFTGDEGKRYRVVYSCAGINLPS